MKSMPERVESRQKKVGVEWTLIWRTIESAPKDGSKLLLGRYGDEEPVVGFYIPEMELWVTDPPSDEADFRRAEEENLQFDFWARIPLLPRGRGLQPVHVSDIERFETSFEAEASYRRGFHQGAWAMFKGFKSKAPTKTLTKWLDAISDWRSENHNGSEKWPPDPA